MAHPYDRTVADLMVEAAAQLEYPTSRGEVVQWFAEHYPLVKASTIRAHIVGGILRQPASWRSQSREAVGQRFDGDSISPAAV